MPIPSPIRLAILFLAVTTVTPAIAQPGNTRDTATSPDGRWRATTRPEPGPEGASGQSASALWLTDTRTGMSRRLCCRHGGAAPRGDTTSVARPDFSLDGHYIYVEGDDYATSSAIYQVAMRDGHERYVVDGALLGVLRTGPWRGYLVVQQHRYYRNGAGSYDPVLVYRPDGKQMAIVPGSVADDSGDMVEPWLKAKGWTLR